MELTPLAVAMIGAGYEPSIAPKALRDAVGVVLRQGEYERQGGKWLLAGA